MNKLSVLCLSDLHGRLPKNLPPSDVVAIAGDICPDYQSNLQSGVSGFDSLGKQAHWLNTKFRDWLGTLNTRKVLATAGNHDWVFHLQPDIINKSIPCEFLIDRGYVFEGKRFHGTPWVPRFYDWAFMVGEDNLRERWRYMTMDLDLLIMHGPPLHCCDTTSRGEHAGSGAAREMIDREKPRFVICGHIHEGHGHDTIGPTHVYNVASVDEWYDLREVPYTMIEL